MDSQEDNSFSCSQQVDSTKSPFHVCNFSQATASNTIPHPFGNLSFQPNYLFHPMNAPHSSHFNQHFGPEFSYQGLLNASQASFDTQKTSSTRKTNKGKVTQRPVDNQCPLPNKNWNKAEDIALTRAWLHISVDADIGNNQKNTTMWERIFIAWKENMGAENYNGRNSNSLNCRWAKIQSAVNKFQGIYERLERSPQSGSTPEDTKREAMRMYVDAYDHKPFKFEHCWEIMRKNPKWCSKELTKTNETRKQRTSNKVGSHLSPKATHRSNTNEGDDNIHVIDNDAAGCGNSDGVVRPQGRKGCKEKKRRLNEDKVTVDALNNLQSTLEKQVRVQQEELELKKEKDKKDFDFREQVLRKEMELKEKAQQLKETKMKLKEKAQELKEAEIKLREKAEKREQQNRIMNQDLGKLSSSLQETFRMYQAQILKEWENDGLFKN